MADDLKSKTRRGAYWMFFNQAANQIMQFVVGIVMARLLSPEDYGITALPAVFMAVAGIFIDSSFGAALIRKPDLTDKDLSTAFYYSLGMGILMYGVLFLSAPWIAAFYNTPILIPLIRVTALNFLWGPLNTPQSVILNRRLDFKTPARISIVNKIVSAIVGIAVAYAGYGLWALVVSGLLSSLLGLIQTWWAVKWLPRERFSRESFKYLWNFGNKMIGASLIGTLYDNIAPVAIGKFCSPRDLGVFNRAAGYVALPVNQITGIIGGVTFPVLSKMQGDDEVLIRNYRRMIKLSTFLVAPILMLLCALARPLVIVLITSRWEACILLIQLLCFSRMWWPLQGLNRSFLQVKGRSDLLLKLEIIKKPVVIAILCCAIPFGIVAVCVSEIIAQVFSVYFNTYFTGKYYNYGLKKQLIDIWRTMLLAVTMLLIVLGITHLISNLYIQIVAGGIAGASFYLGMAYLLRFSELDDVLYMVHLKK